MSGSQEPRDGAARPSLADPALEPLARAAGERRTSGASSTLAAEAPATMTARRLPEGAGMGRGSVIAPRSPIGPRRGAAPAHPLDGESP